MSVGTDTTVNSEAKTGSRISAVMLDKNKVFIAHSGSDDNFYLYGVVCTINNNAIITGTECLLDNTADSGLYASAVSLSSDTVFIVHSKNTSTQLYGKVCKISGTNITSYMSYQLSTYTDSGITPSVTALSENKVFIVYRYNTSSFLYGIVCTISWATITKGSETKLSSYANTGVIVSTIRLSSDKAFVAHSNSGGYGYLDGIVCTISGTTITKGTDTRLSTVECSGSTFSPVLLGANKVFIAHSHEVAGANTGNLYGLICTINGTNISTNTNIQLSTKKGSSDSISAIKISENKVFVFHSSESSHFLYVMICIINGNDISKEEDIELDGTKYSATAISPVVLQDKTIVFHNKYVVENCLNYIVLAFNKYVQPVTTQADDIYGVAKNNTTEGQQVDIYRPKEVAV